MTTKQIRNILLGILLLATNACSGTLTPGYFRPTAGPEKLPLRVVLLDDTGLHPQPYEYKVPGGFGGTFTLTLEPEFSNAVTAEVASLFQDVKLAADSKQMDGEDLIAKASSSFHSERATLSLALLLPGSEEELVRSETSNPIEIQCNSSCGAAAFFTGFSLGLLSPITIPMMSEGQIEPTRTSIEQTTATMLHAFDKLIRSNKGLVRVVRNTQAARSSLAAAEQADKASQRLPALSGYARAFVLRPEPTPTPEMDRRLLAKIDALLSTAGSLPPVPEEARRYVARSNAFMKSASTEGYDQVLTQMDDAVMAAPLWPEATFNRGLIQEAAGQYQQAIRSLSLYLRLAPRAQDAPAVQNKIYELEVMAEKAGKPTERTNKLAK